MYTNFAGFFSNRSIPSNTLSFLKNGSSVAALVSVLCLSVLGSAQAQNAGAVETVTVTGFKASLERALDAKRQATGTEDSILAEDIAKFPDLNLSESIQRLPGVSLSRDQG